MLRRFLRHIYKGEKGITGLETAIILIAFVVVAAVFAYTVLSAGLFATQKSSEAIYSGIKSAQSTMEIKGSVIATANAAGAAGTVRTLSFTVANALGGEPIDLTTKPNNVVVVSYTDKDVRDEDLAFTAVEIGTGDGDNMLDPGEKFQFTITLLTHPPINHTFTIEVKSANGAVLTFERTTPAVMDLVMNFN